MFAIFSVLFVPVSAAWPFWYMNPAENIKHLWTKKKNIRYYITLERNNIPEDTDEASQRWNSLYMIYCRHIKSGNQELCKPTESLQAESLRKSWLAFCSSLVFIFHPRAEPFKDHFGELKGTMSCWLGHHSSAWVKWEMVWCGVTVEETAVVINPLVQQETLHFNCFNAAHLLLRNLRLESRRTLGEVWKERKHLTHTTWRQILTPPELKDVCFNSRWLIIRTVVLSPRWNQDAVVQSIGSEHPPSSLL